PCQAPDEAEQDFSERINRSSVHDPASSGSVEQRMAYDVAISQVDPCAIRGDRPPNPTIAIVVRIQFRAHGSEHRPSVRTMRATRRRRLADSRARGGLGGDSAAQWRAG